jgi:excisionase family DNA binding protein
MFSAEFLKQMESAMLQQAAMLSGPVTALQWPEVMTMKTAAKYMDRSPAAIRRLIRLRELPAIKGDRKLQVRKSAIDEWAGRNEV